MSSRLQQILARVFNVAPDAITADAGPHTIAAWDSAGHMNMIIAVQQEFGIEFGDEEVVELVTVEAIAEALRRKGAAL